MNGTKMLDAAQDAKTHLPSIARNHVALRYLLNDTRACLGEIEDSSTSNCDFAGLDVAGDMGEVNGSSCEDIGYWKEKCQNMAEELNKERKLSDKRASRISILELQNLIDKRHIHWLKKRASLQSQAMNDCHCRAIPLTRDIVVYEDPEVTPEALKTFPRSKQTSPPTSPPLHSMTRALSLSRPTHTSLDVNQATSAGSWKLTQSVTEFKAQFTRGPATQEKYKQRLEERRLQRRLAAGKDPVAVNSATQARSVSKDLRL